MPGAHSSPGSAGAAPGPLQQALAAGDFIRAKSLLLPLVARRPRDADLAAILAECLAHLGEFAQAEHHAFRAAQLAPHDPAPRLLLAKIALARGDRPALERAAHSAAAVAPGHPEPPRLLSWLLLESDRFIEARDTARRARALHPADPDFWLKEGNALRGVGRAEEALAVHEQGLLVCPDSTDLAVARAYGTNFVRNLAPAAIRAAHQHAAQLIMRDAEAARPRSLPASAPRPARPRAPGDRARVGIVSPDLRRHSVAYFLRPILEHHDRALIDLFVYSTTRGADSVTRDLRRFIDPARWRDLPGISPPALAESIAADALDLLIDAAGHTKESHLGAFALRPAPRQATHIGYPATTGLAAIDFRLVDSLTDPPGPSAAADDACTERLVRLDPCFTCYHPPDALPEVAPRPPGRPLTFGSFNMLPKLNSGLFALWARVLDRVPGSRLLIKCRGLDDPAVRADVADRLAATGIPASRADLLGFIPDPAGHLAAYARIDIALDASPYCGTTTTCEALIMGVPVITLAAQPPWHPPLHASRVGASLLHAAGLPEFIADSPDDYVERSAGLALAPDRLNDYRHALRGQTIKSALCDGATFGRLWSDCVCSLL
ncbi:MAG: tetratricopeptide repeat protein [Phycisphaerales bacterium]